MTLEDESGNTNIVVWADTWQQHRAVVRNAPALLVTGTLQRSPEGVTTIIAMGFESLTAPTAVTSRDFR